MCEYLRGAWDVVDDTSGFLKIAVIAGLWRGKREHWSCCSGGCGDY